MNRRMRTGDLVQVIAGADRGKQGRVLAVDNGRHKVRVEKVRMQTRHLKAGRKALKTGGIVEQEGFIDISNVMLVDPEGNAPSRVRVQGEGEMRKRAFTKSGQPVPEPTKG